MPHFTKAIRTEQGFLNFYFNRTFTEEGILYHVSAIGKNGRAIIFHLKKTGNNWFLVKTGDVPAWLAVIEEELSGAIDEHIYGG